MNQWKVEAIASAVGGIPCHVCGSPGRLNRVGSRGSFGASRASRRLRP